MIELFAEYWALLLILLVSSVVAGFAAGLFGIGGGAIIVPTLYYVLVSVGFEESAMHVALATSLATIVPTSIRSVLSHHKRGAVEWSVLKGLAIPIVLGAVLGQLTASWLSSPVLALVFACLAMPLSAQLFFGSPDWRLGADMPSGTKRLGLGVAIGHLSTLMGIGGGVFGVTLLTAYGRPMAQAVGTAAGFGFLIGLPSALSAIITGYGNANLPPFSIGYVNIAAMLCVSGCTVAVAPLGVRAAHALDARLLKRLFGVLLAAVAVHLFLSGVSAL